MLEITNDSALMPILTFITELIDFISGIISGIEFYEIIPVVTFGFALFMLIYSILLLTRQTTSGGGFMARVATFGVAVCFAALVFGMASSLLGFSYLVSGIFNQCGEIVGAVIGLLAVIAFIESVITLFATKRVRESYDSKKVGSSVVTHRILYFVFCILAVPCIILF